MLDLLKDMGGNRVESSDVGSLLPILLFFALPSSLARGRALPKPYSVVRFSVPVVLKDALSPLLCPSRLSTSITPRYRSTTSVIYTALVLSLLLLLNPLLPPLLRFSPTGCRMSLPWLYGGYDDDGSGRPT
jgi:hypothetical protein